VLNLPASPLFTVQQVVDVILSVPEMRFSAAARLAYSMEEGAKLARADIARDVERALHALAEKPVACPTCGFRNVVNDSVVASVDCSK
jgi:hypothetical protein